MWLAVSFFKMGSFEMDASAVKKLKSGTYTTGGYLKKVNCASVLIEPSRADKCVTNNYRTP